MSERARWTQPATPEPSTPPYSGSSSNETSTKVSGPTDDDAFDADSTDELAPEDSPSPSTRASTNYRLTKQKISNLEVREDGSIQNCIDETEESVADLMDDESEESSGTIQSLPVTPSYLLENGDRQVESHESNRKPSASSEPLPIWKLEQAIKEVLQKNPLQADTKKGYAYIYAHKTDEAGFFKIGQALDPYKRETAHNAQCKHIDFKVLETSPKGEGIQLSRRLELLIQTELKNKKHSLNCGCLTNHREYFKGRNFEGVEILSAWGRWLESKPYDEHLRLTPFWQNRLGLLQTNKLHHRRCSTPQCSSIEDVLASSCQDCLRLRLEAWAGATEYDYFEFECCMRVTWGSVRHLILCIWQRYRGAALRLMSYWEKIQPLANWLWVRAIPPYMFLFVVLRLVPSSRSLVAICLLVHWKFMEGWNRWTYENRLAKESGVILNAKPPRTPQPKTLSKPLTEPVASGSKRRSGSLNKPVNASSHPDEFTTPKTPEPPRGSRAATLSPSLMLTEDRAFKMAGKESNKTRGKRRKSGTDITTVT